MTFQCFHVAGLCLMTSLILYDLFREPVKTKSAITDYHVWPFYVSLAACVLTCAATIASLERMRVVCMHQKGYSDLDEDKK